MLSGETRGVLEHEGDGAVASPALGVDAGIHHEAAGSPHLVGQAAEVVVGIGVEAAAGGVGAELERDALAAAVSGHLEAELLGVKTPALDEGGGVGEFAEGMLAVQLLREGDLKMVAGTRFVEREGDHFVPGPLIEAVGVGHEESGQTELGRAAVVVRGG